MAAPVLPNNLDQTWDLEVFFPGGSASPQFAEFFDALEQDTKAFQQRCAATAVPQTPAEAEAWAELLDANQALMNRFIQTAAFLSCLTAQNTEDEQARLLQGRLGQLGSVFAAISSTMDGHLIGMPDEAWQALLALPQVADVSFRLQELRRNAREKLPPEQEALVSSLAVDGYHGWGRFYDTVVGRMKIEFEEDGEKKSLSSGLMANKLGEHDRAMRERLWPVWEQAWAEQSDLFADTLNHLGGFRLNLYRARGWDDVLHEPMRINRMERATLDAMWAAVDGGKDKVVEYLNRKAQLMGIDRLKWHDTAVPYSVGEPQKISYDDGAAFIVEHFQRFNPEMAEFAAMAFRDRWIEAESRPNKRPGGFCTTFRLSGQSRIFMTYDGLMDNVATLAHELGHAYHNWVMRDLPNMKRGYAMNVAETASTFAEMIVKDAAVQAASSRDERLYLLSDKCENTVAFLMNIHARFLFETRFYEERKAGPVGRARLSELMVQAQKDAYRDALAEYHPHFWASKLHFYITGVPFYNFPYTFGYLFSAGVYARAMQEGPSFAPAYDALLRDTASMTVEDLAQKHLGVDLRQPDFWQEAVAYVTSDIDAFLKESA